MLSENRQINSLVLVFIGEFNPVIIQPFWLAFKKIIKAEEAEAANINVIHNDLVKFELEWAHFQITRDRFEIKTTLEAYFYPLRDLALSIFSVLRETPLRAVGINHLRHYPLENEKQFLDLGDKLAPLKNWDSLKTPRLLTLEIIETYHEDGYVRVKIQPSDTLKQNYTFMISINDHHDLKTSELKINSSGEALRILETNWERSFVIANEVEEKINKIIRQ